MEKIIQYDPILHRQTLKVWQVDKDGSNPSISQVITSDTHARDFIQHGPNKFNWFWLIKNGKDATTYLKGRRQRMTVHSLGDLTTEWDSLYVGRTQGRVTGHFVHRPFRDYLDPDTGLETKADSLALGEYMGRVQDKLTKFQSGVFVGEIRETLRMLRNPVSALRGGIEKYLKTVKKRQKGINNVKSAREMVAGTWLEFSFGWRTLISDIEDAHEGLVERLKDLHPWDNVWTKAAEEHVVENFTHTCYYGMARVDVPVKTTERVTVKYRGQVSAASTFKDRQYEIWGLTPWEVVPTIYELLPWSFLVDYFTNLGEIVTAASYCNAGINWTNRTVIREIETQITSRPNLAVISKWASLPRAHKWVPYRATMLTKEVERDSYNGSLVPGLAWKIPTNPMHWVNMWALRASSDAIRNGWKFKGTL